MKKFISILVSILILASFLTFPASAANPTVTLNATTVTIGNKVTVTVTVSPGEAMYAVGYIVKYDTTKLSYQDAAGSFKVVESPTGETTFRRTYTFDTIAVGAASISIVECGYAGADLVDKQMGNVTRIVTVKDKELSANANLSALSLSVGTLNPNFSAANTNYTASVPYETDKITLYTRTADTNAKVNIPTNPTALTVGDNTIKVTVTAQNGAQKIYTLTVRRRALGEEETPIEPTPGNPYETVISGQSYEIVTEIPPTAYLKGFTLSSSEWAGQQVPVLRDKENVFTVYYLREVGKTDISPYVYNSELETFDPLKHIVINDVLYIFRDFPDEVAMPEEYFSTQAQIGDYSVKVYQDTNSQMSDFSYVYCFANGEYGLYRYDSKEGTIQRFPDIHLVDAPVSAKPQKDNFMKRFSSLSTNDKIMLIAFLVAAICVVALIVFLIVIAIHNISSRAVSYVPEDATVLNFEDVTIVGEDNNTLND